MRFLSLVSMLVAAGCGSSTGPSGGTEPDIVFVRYGFDGFSHLWHIQPDGSNARQIPGTFLLQNFPAWSPDRKLIAFWGSNIQDGLWLSGPDGSNPRFLTFNFIPGGGGARPSWTADGSWIYFQSAGGVFRIHPDGSGEVLLVNGGAPAISPDGLTLLFARGGGNEIWIASGDGSNPHFLLLGAEPQWSPDGSRFAYHRAEPTGSGLHTARADGTDERQLTFSDQAPGRQDLAPAWSADGARLLFSRLPGIAGESWDLFILEISSGSIQQVTQRDPNRQFFSYRGDW
jgi:Tol biopolymer transport system component